MRVGSGGGGIADHTFNYDANVVCVGVISSLLSTFNYNLCMKSTLVIKLN